MRDFLLTVLAFALVAALIPWPSFPLLVVALAGVLACTAAMSKPGRRPAKPSKETE